MLLRLVLIAAGAVAVGVSTVHVLQVDFVMQHHCGTQLCLAELMVVQRPGLRLPQGLLCAA